MIKIPSKFIDTYGNNSSIREVYLNLNNVTYIDVEKYIQNVYDKVKKEYTEELEIEYRINIQLVNGNYINIKQMNGVLFEEFILWFNKNMALEQLKGGI